MYEIKPDVITPEFITSKIPQEEIWYYYLGFEVRPGELFISPLRDEGNPSANLFFSRNGDLLLKDFGYKTINVWQFIQYRYGITFKEAVDKVYNDLYIKNASRDKIPTKSLKRRDVTQISIRYLSWNDLTLKYWEQYFITKDILKKYKVLPISHLFVNNRQIRVKQPAFSYEFGRGYRKIYCPESEDLKFISNVPGYMYSGYEQLPWIGDILIITKSHKDVMVFDVLGYNSIASQGEGHKIEEEFLNLLKRRFKHVILNFDNDRAGKYHAEKINLTKLFIPDNDYDLKDISDYIKYYGVDRTITDLNEWVRNLIQ